MLLTKDVSTEAASIEDTCIREIYIRRVYTKDIFSSNVYFAKNAYVKSIGISNICGLAHKPRESFMKYLKLLAESTSKIFISFCLYLQVVLGKVLYCHSTHYIRSIVYLLF